VSGVIERALRSLPSADHRKNQPMRYIEVNDLFGFVERQLHYDPRRTDQPGSRVREVNAETTFPNGKRIAIKRDDRDDAPGTLRWIKQVVDGHNQRYPDAEYDVIKPPAHAISKKLLAMPYFDLPSANEILAESEELRTERGAAMMRQLQKDGIDKNQLKRHAQLMSKRTGLEPTDFFVAGTKNGRPVFMPTADKPNDLP